LGGEGRGKRISEMDEENGGKKKKGRGGEG
jgi:hypothetical protein